MSEDQPSGTDPLVLGLEDRPEYKEYEALQEDAKKSPFYRLGRIFGFAQPPRGNWTPTQIDSFRKKYASYLGTDFKHSMEIYTAYREKVTHEDTLVNFRTSWFMGVQTILFPTYVLTIRFTDKGPENLLPIMVSLVGIVAALTSLVSILAARRAVNKTAEKWTHPYPDKENERFVELGIRDIVDPHGLLPAIKGAGSSQLIAVCGNISSILLPVAVCFFWGYFILNGAPKAAVDSPAEQSEALSQGAAGEASSN